jgi:hypothetical protein
VDDSRQVKRDRTLLGAGTGARLDHSPRAFWMISSAMFFGVSA